MALNGEDEVETRPDKGDVETGSSATGSKEQDVLNTNTNAGIDILNETADAAREATALISKHEWNSLASQVRARGVILPKKTFVLCGLVLILGCTAAAAFVFVGMTGASDEQAKQFDTRAAEVVKLIASTWSAYEFVGLHIHSVCRKGVTRKEFRELYDYLNSTGLVFQSATWVPNVTHDQRAAVEEEANAFYAEFYPQVSYRGLLGLEYNPTTNRFVPGLRSNQSFYFPGHYVEPVLDNLQSLDYDLFSGPKSVTRASVELSLSTWKPALTPRIRVSRDRGSPPTDFVNYSVILLHPGVPLSTTSDSETGELAALVVRIPDFLIDLSTKMIESADVYLYDGTNSEASPNFLGGSSILVGNDGNVITEQKKAVEVQDLLASPSSKTQTSVINIAQRKWTVVIAAVDGSYQPDNTFIILGGVIIVGSCIFLAIWLYTNIRRQAQLNQIEAMVALEKSNMVIESAKKSAKIERDLNDFIAHEVRNPLSAALSACSFVGAAIRDKAKPLVKNEERQPVLDDVHIIDSSLHFINDLLRNMLDMQRASSNQLLIEYALTDLKSDVFMAVDAMLYRRNSSFEVVVECPDDFLVSTDRLRLKQIVLNLGKNSLKFVEKGFVRLRAAEIDGSVYVYVEDSGPGIPIQKRAQLFAKFQESLDVLNQGTGIGLSLCQNLVSLMGAEIWYDESYNSGIDGCPGTRFVINLKSPRMRLKNMDLDKLNARQSSRCLQPQDSSSVDTSSVSTSDMKIGQEVEEKLLPDSLKVLFVDDDLVLRKLFVRAVKKLVPGWKIEEAGNGETALRKIDNDEHFDLIFMDQYMASVEKQLLGTEATLALRSKGVTCKICGLSANDARDSFLEAGANAFMMKPFPCDSKGLTQELLRVLYGSVELEHT